MSERTCSEPGCRNKARARGLCGKCYGKTYRTGGFQLPLFGERHSLSDVDRDEKTAICSVCGPVEVRLRAGRTPECRTVRREQDRRHRVKHPDRHRRRRRRLNPDASPRRKLSPEEARNELLKHKYGITLDDYLRMFETQGGGCAICGKSQQTNLAVDHDHRCCPGKRSCGECVRGLLCKWCNLTLGYMRDDPVMLKVAAEYLTASASRAVARH